jgi:hypothetical protein
MTRAWIEEALGMQKNALKRAELAAIPEIDNESTRLAGEAEARRLLALRCRSRMSARTAGFGGKQTCSGYCQNGAHDSQRPYAVPQRCDAKDRLVDPIVDTLSDILGQGQADRGERRAADGEIDLLGRRHRQICRICPTENFVNIARGSREAFLVARPD